MENFSQAKKLTYFAVLVALTLILQLVGNTVKIGPVTLNFSLIPIVLAAIILGVWYGTALGAITGLIILFHCGILGADGFTNVLFSTDPVVITLVCLLKTSVAGAVSALLFKWLSRYNAYVAVLVASGIVPIINSGLFIVGMLAIVPSLRYWGFLEAGANAFAVIVIGFVGLNFVFEFALNIIVAPALYRILKVIDNSFGKRKNTHKNFSEVSEEPENSGAEQIDNEIKDKE